MLFAPADKDEGYVLYERKAFGNQLITWPSVDDYLASDFQGRVVIRNKIPGDKRCVYGITREEVEPLIAKWDPSGAERKIFKMNESAPDDLLTIQGEVTLEIGHIEVRYSTLPLPMRDALKQGQQIARGFKGHSLLRHYLDDLDYDHLMELLDTYTGVPRTRPLVEAGYHRNPFTLDDPYTRVTIEFSCWGVKVGHWGRRMVVWEIRAY